MAKIHSFEFDGSGNCRVVLHTAMPAGNNAVGNSWKACWTAAGRNATGMTEGVGVGQISTVEKASVVAGDTIEISTQIPKYIIAQGATEVNTFADELIASMKTRFANEFNYYGWTNG